VKQIYLIALGSNRRHHRFGLPAAVLRASVAELARRGQRILRSAPIISSAPIGPSLRRYANSAVLVASNLAPGAMLDLLKQIEADFGRRSAGQRWSSRVIDLDIVLWSGGAFAEPGLVIPHALFRQRDFVLRPAVAIAPQWRDPVTALSLRHLTARLTRPRPVPR